MGWDGTKGGIMREALVPSDYAPEGIPVRDTLGEAVLSPDVLKNTLFSFLKAGGAAAAQTLYEVPAIKQEITAMGVESIKTLEKSKMQQAFDKLYGWYDANRTLTYAGLGAGALGIVYLGYRKLKGRK